MASDKVAAVRRHLIESTPISDLCDELGIKPTQYYTWQKQLFENGEHAYQRCNGNDHYSHRPCCEQQIAKLKDQFVRRSEAMAVAEVTRNWAGPFVRIGQSLANSAKVSCYLPTRIHGFLQSVLEGSMASEEIGNLLHPIVHSKQNCNFKGKF